MYCTSTVHKNPGPDASRKNDEWNIDTSGVPSPSSPYSALPVIAIVIGHYCLTDPISFAVVSVVVLAGGAPIYGVWVHRGLDRQYSNV